MTNNEVLYGQSVLPQGIRSRLIPSPNGGSLHILEAGYETPGRPCVLLIHGFPELAFSWRKQLPALANAGFHAVAPDQRGYGRSAGTAVGFDDDLLPYSPVHRVSDMLGLLQALGHSTVATVVGHDYGAPVAGWCALLRPDVFRSVTLMAAPFSGPPAPGQPSRGDASLHEALGALPRPRKHYNRYYSTREANHDMWRCPQGVHDFLRAYYHFKSADWEGNRPCLLESWAAAEMAKMPTYYVMDRDQDMAQTVAPHMPSAAQIAACAWLTEEELRVYSTEFGRNGFQGGLQSYRVANAVAIQAELRAFAGRSIDVPACFIGGTSDWCVRQSPGALEKMQTQACTRLKGVHMLPGAGHWVQQEQPAAVNRVLLEFIEQARA